MNESIFGLPTMDAFNSLLNLAYLEPSEYDEYPEQNFSYCIKSSNISNFGGCFLQ